MFAPGDREFAGNAAARRGGFGSPELTALATALTSLVAASHGVAPGAPR